MSNEGLADVCCHPSPWRQLGLQPDWRHEGQMTGEWTQNDVKNEPMLFSADLNFASANGGPITRAFITAPEAGW